jgi:hypothetical protein
MGHEVGPMQVRTVVATVAFVCGCVWVCVLNSASAWPGEDLRATLKASNQSNAPRNRCGLQVASRRPGPMLDRAEICPGVHHIKVVLESLARPDADILLYSWALVMSLL